MKNFLKLLLLCLLLLVSACQNSSSNAPAPREDISGEGDEVNVSTSQFTDLDQEKIERILLQVTADTRNFNPQQTHTYFEKLNSKIRLECRDVCEIKLKKQESL